MLPIFCLSPMEISLRRSSRTKRPSSASVEAVASSRPQRKRSRPTVRSTESAPAAQVDWLLSSGILDSIVDKVVNEVTRRLTPLVPASTGTQGTTAATSDQVTEVPFSDTVAPTTSSLPADSNQDLPIGPREAIPNSLISLRRSSRTKRPSSASVEAVASSRPQRKRSRPTVRSTESAPAAQVDWLLSSGILDSIVDKVVNEVTRRLTPLVPASTGTQGTTAATSDQVTEVPFSDTVAPTTSSLPADSNQDLTIGPLEAIPNSLVNTSLLTVQATLTGMANRSSGSAEVPQSMFTSPSLSIDCRISDKLTNKIRDSEYLDLSLLLINPVVDKYQLTVKNTFQDSSPDIFIEPASKSRKQLWIETWISCFHIYVGVYCRRYPSEAPVLMKSGKVVQDLVARGHNWLLL
ncbi:hypothetical protein AWC38_SpisGene19710 [Stylophora pistillata]|uniref:Uncharacterized protein n=1 Tax=Stylophora pistillata TaxID=50429 RepID=A0A2B4RGT6_STYPI|nr:hypothetical protein AWC38_SpisGene19710 [Stylophora pistillata]